MDLLHKEVKKDQKLYKEEEKLQKESAKKEALLPKLSAEVRFQKKEKNYAAGRKLLSIFRKKAKVIQAEGKLKDAKAKSLYTAGKLRKQTAEEAQAFSDLQTEKKNPFISVTDHRVGMKLKELEQRNSRLLEDWPESDEKRADVLMDVAADVMSFNFSIAMTNPAWLENNVETLRAMVRSCSLLKKHLDTETLKSRLPEEARKILETKCDMAGAISEIVSLDAKTRGVELSISDDRYEVSEWKEEDRKKELEKTGTSSLEDWKKMFLKYKEQEVILTARNSTESTVDEVAVERLSYRDFAAMVGTKNRGQVTIKKGKLAIINNGKFCLKKGKATETNLLVKQRFLAVVLEQLSSRDQAYMRPKLMTMLHLYDREEKTSLPLTRSLIKEILTEVNARNCAVDRALKLGQRKENKEHPEVKIANKVDELLPGFPGGIPVTREDRERAKTAISKPPPGGEGRWRSGRLPFRTSDGQHFKRKPSSAAGQYLPIPSDP